VVEQARTTGAATAMALVVLVVSCVIGVSVGFVICLVFRLPWNFKVVVAHEANVTGRFGVEIVARLHELCDTGVALKIKRVGTPNVRIPATPSLSQEVLPNAKRIADAVRALGGG
jgi:hypothetical protein